MTPYYQRDGVTIYHASCMDVFQALDLLPGVSTVVTSPPYVQYARVQSVLMGLVPWVPSEDAAWLTAVLEFHVAWMQRVQSLVERVAGRCWIATNAQYFPAIWRIATLLRWRTPHLWRAPHHDGCLLLCGQGLSPAAEQVIQAAFDAALYTPHEPQELLTAILSVTGGGSVLDPFMGHGSTLVAAKRMGLEVIGIDTDEACVRRAIEALTR